MAAEIQDLTRDTFFELVSTSEQPVIIDFWGPKCRPCLALGPTFDSIAETHPEMRFLRAEAPSNRMLCVDMKVMALPTFVCLVNGVEVSRLAGEVSAANLTHWVKEQPDQTKGDS